MHTLEQETVGLSVQEPVLVIPHRSAEETRAHAHEFCEIGLLVEGEIVHDTPYGTNTCGPGSVIVIQPGEVHGYRPTCPSLIQNIVFLPEWLMSDLPRLWEEPGVVALFFSQALFGRNLVGRTVVQADPRTMAGLTHELASLNRTLESERNSTLLLRYSLLKMLCMLGETFVRQVPELRVAGSFRKEVWYVLHTIECGLMQGETFSLANTADTLGVSRRHLTRMFREVTGKPVRDYYHDRRIHFSKNLLLDASRSVTDVAVAAGYCDTAHFCRDFKRDVGCRPGEYRQRALGILATGHVREV